MQQGLRETAAQTRETAGDAAGASPNAARGWSEWAQNIGVATAAGGFLAFVGALGTDAMPLMQRFLYWLPMMWVGSVLGHLVGEAVGRFVRAETNVWLFGAALTLVLSLPVTLMVWLYNGAFMGGLQPVAALPATLGVVLVICAAMTALMILVSRPGRVTHAPMEGAPAPRVRFMERLPAKLKGAVIYAVSAEDHYLRLHTSKGAELILMRLADAIAELEGLEGAQTHRSWWVAKDAVESARRDGDKMVLTLKGGVEAPVSRPNVRPLREAGWY